ncbi:hypothetical protein VT84_13980 [Gemmata sp. SH-PL17]|uniref:hypothetical protein n=1 Tax=Gemmata sp. SH-PL17 TaxID=1630693 RepID=UPI00078BF22B|nr:hypothetical protein [Gemmata sp. SH-PL17]AMV24608.1 hypothetical protein VT84_09445 [Gemmata sp. SH-PL17]AMV25503.1 hypothetical protein VT84_13980 [Gemmata sp. SH-PL17]
MPPKPRKKKPSQGRPDRGTKASKYRLTDDTLAKIADIAAHIGSVSQAEGVRYAVDRTHREICGGENPAISSDSEKFGN